MSAGIYEFRRSFHDEYPPDFLQKYDQLELLSSGRATETFLVRERGTDELFVAKCYDRSVFSEIPENAVPNELHHSALPEYVGRFEDERVYITVRRYIEGTPLDEYAKSRIGTDEAVRILLELTDILDCLHRQDPPVIHRDIKPENIIVKADGSIALIDFDIARRYSDGADADTQFFGTRVYAPPEQYGFSQTDCRADIYSTGVLLRFLITGSGRDSRDAAIPQPLRRIVKRCTAFSPDRRYPSAKSLARALGRARSVHISRAGLAAALAVSAALALCAGFAAGRIMPALSGGADVEFTEPLIESAARVQLGKSADEPLTAEELQSVTGLYIFGTEVSADGDAFSAGLGAAHTYTRGDISSLADLALMPNITSLIISYQTLRDISGIEKLENLQSVAFMHCYLSDATPLSGLKRLNTLSLFDTNVSDLTCLASCPGLETLDVGGTLVNSCESLPATGSLVFLSLKKLRLASLDGIERLPNLETLDLLEAKITSCSALEKLAFLKCVVGSGAISSEETAAALARRGVELN